MPFLLVPTSLGVLWVSRKQKNTVKLIPVWEENTGEKKLKNLTAWENFLFPSNLSLWSKNEDETAWTFVIPRETDSLQQNQKFQKYLQSRAETWNDRGEEEGYQSREIRLWISKQLLMLFKSKSNLAAPRPSGYILGWSPEAGWVSSQRLDLFEQFAGGTC